MGKLVSIDIGGTNLRMALFDPGSRSMQQLYKKPIDRKNFLGVIKAELDKVNTFDGIGIAMPGMVDHDRKVWVSSHNLKVRNLRMAEILERRYSKRTVLSNDAVAAVMGEWRFGAGRELRNLAYLTFSTGIGCGVIVDGKMLLGKDGNAHEAGHFTIDSTRTMRCTCGSYGHWEAYCSGLGIPNFVRRLLDTTYRGSGSVLRKNEDVTPKDVFDAAGKDRVAAKIVGEIGRMNAIGMSNVVNAYDPEMITIGGSVALNNKDAMLKPMLRHMEDYKFNRIPKVKITPLGESVVLYGAVAPFL